MRESFPHLPLFCPVCKGSRSSHEEHCPYNENPPVRATESEQHERQAQATAIFDAFAATIPSLRLRITWQDIEFYALRSHVPSASDIGMAETRIGWLMSRLRGAEWEIVMIENQASQTKGVATALVARFLMDHPEVDRIRAALAFDNADAYRAARADNKNHVDGITATPLATICAKFGFTKIVSFNEPLNPECADMIPVLFERP